MGIPTWVSLEPVIYPQQALQLIKDHHRVVGHWKVGKLNYRDLDVNWINFRSDVRGILEDVGADYYLKKSLTEL